MIRSLCSHSALESLKIDLFTWFRSLIEQITIIDIKVHCIKNIFFQQHSLEISPTKRCFFVQKDPIQVEIKSRGFISVPYFKVKLGINIFRSWDKNPSSSTYVFIKSPISLLTKVFLKLSGKLAKPALNFLDTLMSHWTQPNIFPFSLFY